MSRVQVQPGAYTFGVLFNPIDSTVRLQWARIKNCTYLQYGITGCGIFKAGIQNWKGFCIKINCSQRKLLNFENWTNGEPQ